MAPLINLETGIADNIPDGEKEQAFLSGKYGLPKDSEVNLIAPSDGKSFRFTPSEVQEALQAGFSFESEEGSATRDYNKEIGSRGSLRNIYEGGKRFTLNAIDEFLIGAPEIASDAYQGYKKFDPTTNKLTEYGKRSLEKEAYSISNLAGGLTGFAGSLLYGGPLWKGAALAGEGAGRVALRAAETLGPKVAESIAAKVATRAVEGVAQGAAIGAIPASAKAIGSILGDQETVSEALLTGAGEVALYGALGGALSGGIAATSSALSSPLAKILKVIEDPNNSGKFQAWADTAYIRQLGGLTKEFNAITANKNYRKVVDPENYADDLSRLNDKELVSEASSFLRKNAGMSDFSPRSTKAAQGVINLEERGKTLLEERAALAGRIDKAAPKGLVDADNLIKSLDDYAQSLNTTEGKKVIGYQDAKTIVDIVTEKSLAAMESRGANASANLSLREAEEIRKAVGKFAFPVNDHGMTYPLSDAASAAYAMIRQKIGSSADAASKLAGKGELGKQFLQTGKEIERNIFYTNFLKGVANRNISNALISPFDIIAGAAATGATGATGILTGIATFAKRQYGNLMGEKVLLGASSLLDSQTKRIRTGIDTMLGLAKSEPTQRAAKLGSVNLLNDYFKDASEKGIKERHQMIDALSKQLAVLQADPSLATKMIASATKNLSEISDEIPSTMAMKMGDAFNYLSTQIPKPQIPVSPLNPKPFIPSDREIASFERKLHAVLDPYSIFEEINNGTVTREQIEAVKAVYPKIFESIQTQTLDRLADYGPKIPYEKRKKIGMLLETPMGIKAAPNTLKTLQQNFVTTKKPTPRANSKITEASRGTTDIDRIIRS